MSKEGEPHLINNQLGKISRIKGVSPLTRFPNFENIEQDDRYSAIPVSIRPKKASLDKAMISFHYSVNVEQYGEETANSLYEKELKMKHYDDDYSTEILLEPGGEKSIS